jgi:antitoxin HicB
MSEFNALFEPDEQNGGFVVTFPDFEWGVTQGDTEAEATEMAVDALTMVIADYIGKGKELPAAGKHRGRKYRVIRLPALVSAKTELYRAFLASGIRKAELARRLGISKGNIERLFDLKHHTRLDQLEAAFRAIGKRLSVEVHNEAA